MAENTPVPLNRIERSLAFMIGGVAGISLLAIIAIFAGGAMHAVSNSGVWPIVAVLPLVGLPIAFALIVVFLVLTVTRRRRIARGGAR